MEPKTLKLILIGVALVGAGAAIYFGIDVLGLIDTAKDINAELDGLTTELLEGES